MEQTDCKAELHDIIDACMNTKHMLGAGHTEKVYQRILMEKLLEAGFQVQQEIVVPVRTRDNNYRCQR